MSVSNTPPFSTKSRKKHSLLFKLKGTRHDARSDPTYHSEKTFAFSPIETELIQLNQVTEKQTVVQPNRKEFLKQTTTFEHIPKVLENSLRYIETVIKENKKMKPFGLMTKEEIEVFIDRFEETKLTEFVKNENFGKEIKRMKYNKLIKLGISDTKANFIIKSISNHDNKSKIGKHILCSKVKIDKALRKMFELFNSYLANEIIPFSHYSKDEAHLIAFMVIRNYFAMKESTILNEQNVCELIQLYNTYKIDEFQLLAEVREFLGRLEGDNGVILLRMIKFMNKMVNNERSYYYYYKELFLETMFSMLYIGERNNTIQLFFLVGLSTKLNKKACQSKEEKVFESNNLYCGEMILNVESNCRIPLYMIVSEEQINREVCSTWINGKLYLTNYRIIWKGPNDCFNVMGQCNYFSQVPLKMIYQINVVNTSESSNSFKCLKILTFDNKVLLFAMQNEDRLVSFKRLILLSKDRLFKNVICVDSSEHLYYKNVFENVWQKTASRIGININNPNCLFKVETKIQGTRTIEGIVFKTCHLKDESQSVMDELKRTPLLIHRDNNSGSYLFRLQYLNHKDTANYQLRYPDTLKQVLHNIITVDISFFQTSEKTNILKPKEDIDKILKATIDSMNKIKGNDCKDLNESCNLLLIYLRNILGNVMNYIDILTKGKSIIFLPTTNNASEICIYSSLTLLLSESYYRSFTGFLELIYNEYIQYGYFNSLNESRLYPSHFLCFLIMVYSFIYSHPNQFGFNLKLIQFLHQHCNSSRFSAFEQKPTQSLFYYLISKRDLFVNSSFVNSEYNFVLDYKKKELFIVYPQYFFFRWMNYTSNQSDLFDTSASSNFDLHGRNSLTEIPSYIRDVSNAKVINLSNNPLRTIPECLKTLTTLQDLLLSNCGLNYIPQTFFILLTNLTFLDLSHNSDRKNPFFIPSLKVLTNLKYLDLSSQIFAQNISIHTFEFPINIRTLILSKCIKELPNTLSQLKGLETLNVSKNEDVSLDVLPELKSLNELILSACNKESLPNEISCLINLTKLDLSRNEILKLPLWLFEMTNLKELNLNSNNLDYLSVSQTKLTSLTKIDIGNNSIKYLPTVHPILKPTVECRSLPYIINLRVLSDHEGIRIIEKQMNEWLEISNSSVVLLHQEENYFDYSKQSKKKYFLLDYNEYTFPIPFTFSKNDCYLIVLTSKDLTPAFFWKYYLEQLMSPSLHIFVLLLADIKASEKSYIQSKIKDAINNSSFLSLSPKDNSKTSNERFCEWINDFKQSINDDYQFLVIKKELSKSDIQPPIAKRKELEDLLLMLGVNKDRLNPMVDCLDQDRIIISSSSFLKNVEECNPQLLRVMPSFHHMEEMYVAKMDIFSQLYDIIKSVTPRGISTIEDVINKIQPFCEIDELELSYLLLIMQMHEVLVMVPTEWLDQFNLNYTDQDIILVEEKIRKSIDPSSIIFHHDSSEESVTDLLSAKLYVHSVLPPPNKGEIQRVWPLENEYGYAEFDWAFGADYVPLLILGSIVASLMTKKCELVTAFYKQVIFEFVACESTHKIMIELKFSKIIFRVRYNASSVSQAMCGIQFCSELNEMFTKIISFYSEEMVKTRTVICPRCVQEGRVDCEEILEDILNVQIRNGLDNVAFGENKEENKERHIMQTYNISLYSQLKILTEEFHDFIIEGSRVKIKRCSIISQDYKMYDASYNEEIISVKLFSFEGRTVKGGSTSYLGNVLMSMMREVSICKQLGFLNILHVIGISLNPLALLVDQCEQSLSMYLYNGEQIIDWRTKIEFLLQICTGMKILHSVNLVHRNLKTSSIMLRINPDTKEKYCVISDLGKTIPQNMASGSLELPSDDKDIVYIAPEIIQQQGFKFESDVYSFGIVLWEIVQRVYPFEKNKQPPSLKQQICNGIRPFPNIKTPLTPLNKLVTRCWHQQPTNRPSFSTICSELEKLRSDVIKNEKKK